MKVLLYFCQQSKPAAERISGALSQLIILLQTTENPALANTIFACLERIAYHSVIRKKMLLRDGIIIPLLIKWAEKCLKIDKNQEIPNLLHHFIVRMFYRLCSPSAPPNIPVLPGYLLKLKDFLPLLSRILNHFLDIATIEWGCCALSHFLTLKIPGREEAVVNSGVCARLVELLVHIVPKIADEALLVLRLISEENKGRVELIMNQNKKLLPNLVRLVNFAIAPEYKLERIYKLLRNLMEGTPEDIQKIIDAPQLVFGIVVGVKEGKNKTMRRAARAIQVMAKNGSQEQVEYLVEYGAVQAICHQMSVCLDLTVIKAKLDALDQVLKRGMEHSRHMLSEWCEIVKICDGKLKLYFLM